MKKLILLYLFCLCVGFSSLSGVPLLVPLFISAFRRANDLAMAMEARCYRGGEGRTKMKPLIYHKRDYIAYGCIAAYMVISIVVGRLPFLP